MVTNPFSFVQVKCYDTETEYKLSDKLYKEQILRKKSAKVAAWSILLNVVLFIGILILL